MAGHGERQGFLTGIESVRGLAAITVAVWHTSGFLLLHNTLVPFFRQPTLRDQALSVFNMVVNGQNAVLLFFVISGLVIGRSLDRGKEIRSGKGYLLFLIRRFLRIYPASIVAVLGMLLLAKLFLIGRAPLDLSSYTNTGIDDWFAPWLNGAVFNPLKLRSVLGNFALASWSILLVAWTLYVEVTAAPLLPLFHYLSRRGNALLDITTMLALLALMLVGWGHLWCQYWFAFHLGMLVDSRGQAIARRLTAAVRSPGIALTLAFLSMAVTSMFTPEFPALMNACGTVGAFTLLSVLVWNPDGAANRFLNQPLLRWNGRLSYSFYLWHFSFLTVVVRGLYATLTHDQLRTWELPIFLGTLVVTGLLAFGVAQLSYNYIELPFVWLGRWIGRLLHVAPINAPVIAPVTVPAAAAGILKQLGEEVVQSANGEGGVIGAAG